MQLFVVAATNALSVQLDETNVMQCAGEWGGETWCMSGKLVAAEAGSGKGREWKGMMQTSHGGNGLTVRGKRNLFDSGKVVQILIFLLRKPGRGKKISQHISNKSDIHVTFFI